MNRIITICVLTLICACGVSQDDPNRSIVDEFIQGIINEEITTVNADKYFDAKKSFTWEEEPTWAAFNRVMDPIRKNLTKHANEYRIIPQNDFQDLSVYQRYKKYYSQHEHVYFVAIGKEGALPIVVKDGKIYSFFTNIIKGQDSEVSPALLDMDAYQ